MSLVTRRMRMHAYQLFKHAYQLFKYACHGPGGPSTETETVRGDHLRQHRRSGGTIYGNIDGPGGDHLLQGGTVHDDIDGPGGTIHVVMDGPGRDCFWGGPINA